MLAPLEDEFGPEPPKDWPDQPSVLRKPQEGKPRKYKSKVLLIDSSKNVKDKERMILVSDDDGTLVRFHFDLLFLSSPLLAHCIVG